MSAERFIETKISLPEIETIEAIIIYCEMLSVQSQKQFSIPTLQMLQESLLEKSITPIGKEWTREGYIFDGLTGNLEVYPSSETTAKYRLIELYDA